MRKNSPILLSKISSEVENINAEVINANYLQIAKIANSFSNKGVSREDLISAGIIGLLKAHERFDPRKKVKLSTYAYLYIEKEIHESFNSLISNGIMSNVEINNKKIINRIINKMEQNGIYNPSAEDISNASGNRFSAKYVDLMLSSTNVLSLDYLYKDDLGDSYSLADTVFSIDDVDIRLEEKQYEERLNNKVKEMLGLLNDEEQTVIKIYFNEGVCSFIKTARFIKYQPSKVKSIFYRAISRIRNSDIKSFSEEDKINNLN